MMFTVSSLFENLYRLDLVYPLHSRAFNTALIEDLDTFSNVFNGAAAVHHSNQPGGRTHHARTKVDSEETCQKRYRK